MHPKTLRKAREVRTQLLDIMKHQKLDIIPCGTDWDVIRYVRRQTLGDALFPPSDAPNAGKPSVQRTSIKPLVSRVSESTSMFEVGFP